MSVIYDTFGVLRPQPQNNKIIRANENVLDGNYGNKPQKTKKKKKKMTSYGHIKNWGRVILYCGSYHVTFGISEE